MSKGELEHAILNEKWPGGWVPVTDDGMTAHRWATADYYEVVFEYSGLTATVVMVADLPNDVNLRIARAQLLLADKMERWEERY